MPKHATLHLSRDVQSFVRLSLGSMLCVRVNWFGEMTHHLLHIDFVSSLSTQSSQSLRIQLLVLRHGGFGRGP